MKILIVDDSITMLMTLELMLREIGYTDVVKTESPQESIKIAAAIQPNLILLDWNMPVMDGLTVLKIIKADEQTKNIPVIMVTMENAVDRVSEAIQNGAEGFILKPVNKELLRIRLQDIESSHLLGLKQ